ncbi:MAG: nitroreductase family protein [archaeon]|nr:nitroreductase family protein [archaeon]
MDAFDAIATKLETRQFDKKEVSRDVKRKVLEAARLTGSSNNTQHWRFILLEDAKSINCLAEDATTGPWVKGANFAVLILANPQVNGYMIDVGRALQDMQLTAWNLGIGSGIFTGFNQDKLRQDFAIPQNLVPAAALGFGYPAVKKSGKKKKRNPLNQIAYSEKFGQALAL